MAVSPVLADGSYYIQLLRQGRNPPRALVLTASSRELAVCGVVRCEVGRALRQAKVRVRFQAAWDVMINVPTDNRLWAQAEETLWSLDRVEVVIPLTEVVIACRALRIGAVVLTYNRHFHSVPGSRVTDRLEV